jgi:hypothetical protein
MTILKRGDWCAARLLAFVTLCRPNSGKGKTRLKLGQIRPLKNTKRGFDRSVDSPFELGFDLCFQQNVYGGWVSG